MDSEQTLKILKMVQEGFLTPEQGQRLILELVQQDETAQKPEPAHDLFNALSDVGRNLGESFEQLFEKASQTFRQATGNGPQTVLFKVLDAEGLTERNQVSVPLKVLLALKPLMLFRTPLMGSPLQQIDFEAIFRSLETASSGKVFEYVNRERDEKLEVWLV
ncbi:MAG: hypothetical protein HKM06_08100 [Spirochaetales bacterium]|nr:hypothetical protein [Spirochaetales bacterium]